MRPFNPAEIEAAVQSEWRAADVYRAVEDNGRKKFYCVSMLPYPSGNLHMGHVRNYTINDMMYRHQRMNGYNVLMPMGWDAFGLPAENAAMKAGVAPAKWTHENIAYMKRQCQTMGWAIDWSRELATCDPAYYKWNQWFFLKMLENGIAYRKTSVVNWDPVDQTVLANEQVIDGHGWRSGAPVEKREIPMYYLRITDYADELLSCLDKMPGWPERVKDDAGQLDRQEPRRALRVHARHLRHRRCAHRRRPDVRVHHTRRHDHGRHVLRRRCRAPPRGARRGGRSEGRRVRRRVQARQREGSRLRDDGEEGLRTGLYVTHPITREKVEVWVGNYVLMAYGDGAVMGVPAHDERDFEFAKKYGLPIKQVIRWLDSASGGPRADRPFSADAWQPWYAEYGVCTGSGKYDGIGLRPRRRRDRRRAHRDGFGREEGNVPFARLGHLAAAILGHADPDRPLCGVRRRAGAGEGPARHPP
jgi:leucyl-tRNA synthetase